MVWRMRGPIGAILLLAGTAPAAFAIDTVQLTLKDHLFTPNEATVKAGERFRIELTNQDATPSELESSEMRFEKIAPPGAKVTVTAGPLKPGRDRFFDDYHPETAIGTIVAVDKQN